MALVGPDLQHARHYSLAEANAMIGDLRERIAMLRSARAGLTDSEARGALDDAAPTNGGGAPGKVVSEGFLGLRSGLAEIGELGIVLRDLDRGLVDFPSLRDGEEIYLCWTEDEDEIAYWHSLESGFAGREPL